MHTLSHPEAAAAERQELGLKLATESTALEMVGPVSAAKAVTKRWTIPGDAVAKATEFLPEFERDQLRWAARYAAGRNLTPDELGEQLEKQGGEHYSGDSIYQALTGRRAAQGASSMPLAKAISALRKRIGETETSMATRFIETPMTRRIFKACRRAYLKKLVTFIYGESQTGKSTTVTEYARLNNHGETIVVRMPTRGALSHLLWEMARRLNIPSKLRESELRARIFDCFDSSTLLIVDEAHQCMYSRSGSGAGEAALEFIRELHDRRKCGVVLVGTNVLKTGILESKLLGQLWRRRSPGSVIQLPDMVPVSDLAEFAMAFGLDPAPDRDLSVRYQSHGINGEDLESRVTMNPLKLQDDIVRREGLGSWLKLLDDAKDMGAEKKKAVSWGIVITQYCLAQAMERGEA
jgi:DNA transposition AAA+ family ATPase